jgi:hypothetical protein
MTTYDAEVRAMAQTYNVIDADGHILEAPDLWERYMEPKFREGCPKLITLENGAEIFRVEYDDAIDLSRGKKRVSFGAVGAYGSRDGKASPKIGYAEGRAGQDGIWGGRRGYVKGGFDPHARIPDMDAEGVDAAFLYPKFRAVFGFHQRSSIRGGGVPGLQSLARRLLPSLSGAAFRSGDAADADRRGRHSGDGVRRQGTRLSRGFHSAQSV